MDLQQFPVHVSLMPDEIHFDASVLIHRRIDMPHIDSMACGCSPHRFTHAQLEMMDHNDLNRLLETEIH